VCSSKWGTAQELVPADVWHALQAVSGLRKGRTEAREPKAVQPIPDHIVDATTPHLPEVLADMVRFQRLTGCRPAESERKRRAAMHERRRTPLSYGNRPGTNRKRKPKRRPGDRYDTNSYRRALHRAVQVANRKRGAESDQDPLPKWSPNRLRHSAATEIRKHFGLEAAQVTLGHATADVSQIHAERDLTLTVEVMRKIG